MNLNSENYYEHPAMSASQYLDWRKCPAYANAKWREKTWQDKENPAMILGQYVHTAFESQDAHAKFCFANDIIKKNGEKKVAFSEADKMIARLQADKLCMFYLSGEKEKYYTGKIARMEWKIKVDVLNLKQGWFSDLKTCRSFEWEWVDGVKMPWYEKYNYWARLAIYREILKQNIDAYLTPIIVAVTKEAIPDIAIFSFDNSERLQKEIEKVQSFSVPIENFNRCERCDFCLTTKKVDRIEIAQSIF